MNTAIGNRIIGIRILSDYKISLEIEAVGGVSWSVEGNSDNRSG